MEDKMYGKTLEEWIAQEKSTQRIVGYAGDIIGHYEPAFFVPRKSSDFYGDQKQLISFMTLHQRGLHWVLQVDSKIDINSDYFKDEQQHDIIKEMQEEFGEYMEYSPDYFESYEDFEAQDYPMIYTDDGWGWSEIVNFGSNGPKKVTAATQFSIDVECPYCGESFDAKNELAEHLPQHSLSCDNVDQIIRCPECGASFEVEKIEY